MRVAGSACRRQAAPRRRRQVETAERSTGVDLGDPEQARAAVERLVAPGFIETDMTADIEDWKRREVDARIPIGRWSTPDDVAGAVAWLLSDDARYVTGATVPVDGGYLAR